MSISITNPWINLLAVNLGFFGVFSIWFFVGEWWEKRGGGKALQRSVMIVIGLVTLFAINIFAVPLLLVSS